LSGAVEVDFITIEDIEVNREGDFFDSLTSSSSTSTASEELQRSNNSNNKRPYSVIVSLGEWARGVGKCFHHFTF
jgi:hypothetical protein